MHKTFTNLCGYVLYLAVFPIFFAIYTVSSINEENGCPIDRAYKITERYIPLASWVFAWEKNFSGRYEKS
jgi:hypothetical protein